MMTIELPIFQSVVGAIGTHLRRLRSIRGLELRCYEIQINDTTTEIIFAIGT
jgi:hypothetical protein